MAETEVNQQSVEYETEFEMGQGYRLRTRKHLQSSSVG